MLFVLRSSAYYYWKLFIKYVCNGTQVLCGLDLLENTRFSVSIQT